ncbi:LuxR C-terminal-related transcriptional regulator [Terrabacter sp. LjRoot27]|uniref:LuxR family transcriptional regulator n=1 Tax=Terrabacter sp. LjRoot27 TaxID=3342306 RepID=UPI003ECF7510
MSQSREVAAASAARDLAVAAARGESLAPLLPVVVEVLRADAGVGLTRLRRTAQGVDVTVQVAGSAPITAEMGRLAAEVADQHPAIPLLSTSGAVRVSDLVPIRDFWHTEVYARMHGHVGGRYPVAVMLHSSPTDVVFLGAHRAAVDFRTEDLHLLEAIQRPLGAALAFRAALDETTAALRGERPSLPSGTVDLVHEPVTALCAAYRPTRREGEVLALAAAGWTNLRIARRLGITERTVRKHLSSVYEQSGRRGRAAAAAWWVAMQDLD